jgi:hypothetical protein
MACASSESRASPERPDVYRRPTCLPEFLETFYLGIHVSRTVPCSLPLEIQPRGRSGCPFSRGFQLPPGAADAIPEEKRSSVVSDYSAVSGTWDTPGGPGTSSDSEQKQSESVDAPGPAGPGDDPRFNPDPAARHGKEHQRNLMLVKSYVAEREAKAALRSYRHGSVDPAESKFTIQHRKRAGRREYTREFSYITDQPQLPRPYPTNG